MLDHSEKVLMESEDMIEQNKGNNNDKKICSDCGTSKTPLWRGGPAGPKSLCNACGIRNRKRRQGTEGIHTKKPKKLSSGSGGGNPNLGGSLKQNLMDLEIKKRSMVEKQVRELREEEEAAVLLMNLSCGSVLRLVDTGTGSHH